MNTKIVKYTSKYLSTSIVDDCFEDGKHNFVDKTLTGNGFTHSFLHTPVPIGKTNIIIVPNRQVVISKQETYNGDNRVGFIYGDPKSDSVDFNKYDILVFVADSFMLSMDKLIANLDKIYRILQDEVHTGIIQSTYRNNLRGLSKFIDENFPSKARVSVTATPMLFQKVDIKLQPESIEARDIVITQNQDKTLERIKGRLKSGKKCLVALQDARLLKGLVDNGETLEARFKTGKRLFSKILETLPIKENEDSNLVIISSAGFEGFDINDGIYSVFILEDRARDYSTYYPQNVPQIIGRPRLGTDYIEWSCFSNSGRTKIIDWDELERQAKSKAISHEKKQSSPKYSALRKYSSIVQDSRLGLITEIVLDRNLYDLDKEKIDLDLNGLDMYSDFFSDRGFTLIDDRSKGSKRSKLKNSSHKQAHKFVQLNRGIVESTGVFDKVEVDLYPKESLNGYQKAYEIYLRRKYWDAPVLAWDDNILPEDVVNVMKFNRELTCLAILKDEKKIEKGIKHITKFKKQQKKEELGRKSKEYKKWLIEFEMSILNVYPRLLMMVSQGIIKAPSKMVNSRDFNLTTSTSIEVLEAVTELFDVEFKETDIVSCNPRIIYALLGLELPSNFYGLNKINKKRINILLNTISKHHAISKKIDVAQYKKDKVKEMRKYGFDEKVVSFLITEFWDKVIDNFTYLGKDGWFDKSENYEDTTEADEVFLNAEVLDEAEAYALREFTWNGWGFNRGNSNIVEVDDKSRESDLNSVKNQVINIYKGNQLEIELKKEYKLKTTG